MGRHRDGGFQRNGELAMALMAIVGMAMIADD